MPVTPSARALELIALLAGGALAMGDGPTFAQVVRQLTDNRNVSGYDQLAFDDSGSTLFTTSSSDAFGTNPEHRFQLNRWELPTASGSQVGAFLQGVAESVSVSDDGQTIAFISYADPLGTNHDGGPEIFLMQADGTVLEQVTDDPAANPGEVLDVRISGSGNRVLFVARTDALGSNPGGVEQLYVYDPGSSQLLQLTNAVSGEFRGFDISDDGQRVVFAHEGVLNGSPEGGFSQIYTILSNGSGFVRRTPNPTADFSNPVISGNGQLLVFIKSLTIQTMPWSSLTFTQRSNFAESEYPMSITDDGQWVYFVTGTEIRRVNTSGPLILEQLTPGMFAQTVAVSGDGTRVAFAGADLVSGVILFVMDPDGGNLQPLDSQGASRYDWEPDITPDGTKVAFRSALRPVDPGTTLHRIDAAGTGLLQIPVFRGKHVDIAADGSTVTFASIADLTGENPCQFDSVFVSQVDGSGLTQISPLNAPDVPDTVIGCESNDHPAITPDGSDVAFERSFVSLIKVSSGGGSMTTVVDDGDGRFKFPRLSNDGNWVTYQSRTDDDGQNPSELDQIFRARTDGSFVERVTLDPDHHSTNPDISGDGQRIVFHSTFNPLGTNPDLNNEIFLYDVASGAYQQLTQTDNGDSEDAAISRDGSVVYFYSSAEFFEPDPIGHRELYRVTVGTGVVERAGGPRDRRITTFALNSRDKVAPSVDATGDRVAFAVPMDPVGENPDRSLQLFLVDRTTPPRIEIGPGAPTVISWEPEPSPIRYDVIRGDVANLQVGPGGLAIDLGPVACLEDDSPDTNTLGFEDNAQPVPGQVLFYLYRGTQGLSDGPGSWGKATGGLERTAGNGDCPG